jgi:hypothetical protein
LVAIRTDDRWENVRRDFPCPGTLEGVCGFPRSIRPCEDDSEIMGDEGILRAFREQFAKYADSLL